MPPLHKDEFWNENSERSARSSVQHTEELKFIPLSRKQVHFNDDVDVKHVLHRTDYTDFESENAWYSIADYGSFREDSTTTVRLIVNRPGEIDNVRYASRGVEHRISSVREQRYRIRIQARSAVLDEQLFQRSIGERDNGIIATLYKQKAESSLQDALEMATRDQCDATLHQNEILREENDFSDEWIKSISTNHSCAHHCRTISWSSGFNDSWISEIAAPLMYI